MVGVILIARSVEGSASLFAVGLALLSALSWAVGNLFLRETRAASVLSVTAWASLVPPIPLLIAGLVHDGWAPTLAPILAPTWRGWFVLFYTVVPVMWLGYLALGHAAAHLPGRQGRAGLAAGAVLRPGLLEPAHRRDGRGPGDCWELPSCWAGWPWASSPPGGGAEKENGSFRPRFPPMRQSVAA